MRIIILGAAGRDFHDFLTLYRDDPTITVVAFTATQIPYIEQRRFPAALAGPRYPDGIPIVVEADLEEVIRRERVEQVVFAYSDVSMGHIGQLAARVVAAGADFVLPGARTMLPAKRPVLGVGAVRTGCGKSQVVRFLLEHLATREVRAVGIRHPMPYGDLVAQAVQRFGARADLDAAACTIEEREEYEPYLEHGLVVYAGVDYRRILAAAEAEAEVVLWDGGNNDLPLIRPDLHIVLLDPHRPGSATSHYPSEAQVRMADVLLIAKSDTASPEAVAAEIAAGRRLNPAAPIIEVGSRLSLCGMDEAALRGRRVVCVEDGPTTTHGGMAYGAAILLAKRAGAEIVDPRPYFVGSMVETLRQYPHIGPLVPALGYAPTQIADMEATLRAVPAEIVLAGTPIDLAAQIQLSTPIHRVRYDLEERPGEPSLAALVQEWLSRSQGSAS